MDTFQAGSGSRGLHLRDGPLPLRTRILWVPVQFLQSDTFCRMIAG